MPAGAGDEPTPCQIASQAFTAPRPEIARPLSHRGRGYLYNIFQFLCALTIELYCCFFSARCNIYIYISRLCYDLNVHLSVCLSVTEVHSRMIANLGFKFRSQFTTHCGRGACGREHWTICSSVGTREVIIAGKSGGIISRYASHC